MVDYLRLSVTDKCNLNCSYCTPRQRKQFLTHNEILRYEEMARIVRVFVTLGVRKVRITGGEPLIKRNIASLIKMLKPITGLEEISMTTNGVYLKKMAPQLKEAGLDRINISIDTLKKAKYMSITGADYFENVWAGIIEALKTGILPVKLNVVMMKGINDDEICDLAQLTMRYPLNVRFIEFFPTSIRSGELMNYTMDNKEVKGNIEERFGRMNRDVNVKGNGPAENYKLKGAKGHIGFISSFSCNFCDRCTRVRMDCAGRISPCLFSVPIYNLREILRAGGNDKDITDCIKNVFDVKPKYNKEILNNNTVEMSSIGG